MENKETLYWTIGGVGLALLGIFAFTHQQSQTNPSSSVSEAPAVSSSDLTSQVNNVNALGAQVEETFLNDRTAYATVQSTNKANITTNRQNDVAEQAIDHSNNNAATAQTRIAAAAADVASQDNMLADEFEATQARILGVTQANATTQQTRISTTGQTQQTRIATTGAVTISAAEQAAAESIAATQASAETAAAQAQANAEDTQSNNNLFGGIFSGLLGLFA